MTLLKASQIDLSGVTDEQKGCAYKTYVGSVPFWKVASASDPFKQHTVTWTKEFGFNCTCPAGMEGFRHCKDTCWHVRAALACEAEMREAVAELEAMIETERRAVTSPAPIVDAQTRARIAAANERAARQPASKAQGYQPKPFSLLR
jgi:hypothetical protein